jgi:hypothetical protein
MLMVDVLQQLRTHPVPLQQEALAVGARKGGSKTSQGWLRIVQSTFRLRNVFDLSSYVVLVALAAYWVGVLAFVTLVSI